MITRPDFLDSPYFSFGDGDGWKLLDGAPDDVKKEFEEYMKLRKEDEEKGLIS